MNQSASKFHVLLLTLIMAAGRPALTAGGASAGPDHHSPIAVGTNQMEIVCHTNPITVFTYKPPTYRAGPLIVVFHGRSRNAGDYRDYAITLANRLNAVVAVPLFDEEHFSIEDYTLGGVLQNDIVQPRENWLFARVEQVVGELRLRERKPDLDYYLLGHSAGGQMLMRLAALHPLPAKRIVVANPGSHLFPRRDWEFGYGFGGLPAPLSDDAALQRYLAEPVTLYLGTADILTDQANLDRGESAMRQGAHRLERGRNCFEFAAALARTNGWTFNWRKVETPDIAHDGKGMLAAREVDAALFGSENSSRLP
jgi:poly(3-hydroxybutyrate) depolymerase